jgi:hypothetical protein
VAFRPRRGPQQRPFRRKQPHHLALLLVVALGGCAGAKPKQAGEENNFSETPSGKTSESAPSESAPAAKPTKETWAPSPKEPETSPLNADQKAQMDIALRRGGEKAANCAAVVSNAPTGEGEVKVAFDGKKGRCVGVTVGPPFAGTPAESCIKRAFVGEIIVPFEGVLEVPYTVKLAPKPGGNADAGKDDKDKDDDKGKGKGKGKKK